MSHALYTCALMLSLPQVVGDYDCMLNQTNIGQNNNKFYVIQLLVRGSSYSVWTRWGRVGESGQNSNKMFRSLEAAEKEFCKKFREKTKNSWEERENFTALPGKYTLLEMDDEEGGEEVRGRGEGGAVAMSPLITAGDGREAYCSRSGLC